MLKIWVFTACIVITAQNFVQGELYRDVDENGALHIIDSSANVPAYKIIGEDKKNNGAVHATPAAVIVQRSADQLSKEAESDKCEVALEANLRECRNALKIALHKNEKPGTNQTEANANAVLFCRHPLIRDRLTVQERESVTELSRQFEISKGLITKKELYELDEWASRFLEDCAESQDNTYSKQELEKLDVLLKNIWRDMIAALANNDIEKAVSYFVEPNQDTWKEQFEGFPKDKRITFAHRLAENQIAMVSAQGTQAIYQMLTTSKGERYSFQLLFIKNVYGKWKIDSF